MKNPPLALRLACAALLLAALPAAAAPDAAAPRATFCSGNDFAAVLIQAPAEGSRLLWVDLRGPLTEDSLLRTALEAPEALRLSCAGGQAIAAGDGRSWSFRMDEHFRLREAAHDPQPPTASPTVEVGCAPAAEFADAPVVSLGLNKQTSSRRGEIGRKDRYRLQRIEDESEDGERRVRLVLRERMSERVERHLVLAELSCSAAGGVGGGVSGGAAYSQPFSRAMRAASTRLETPSLEIASDR